MECEAEERAMAGDSDDAADDPFVNQGLSTASDSDVTPIPGPQSSTTPAVISSRHTRASNLAAGRLRREQLKDALLRHKERRARYDSSENDSN
jgi:hypothetical protein